MRLEYFNKAQLSALWHHGKSVGWYDESDWGCYLDTGRVLGHVGENGSVLSSAYFSNFQNRLGWLGAFIVAPELRGQGLGRKLMTAIESAIPPAPFVFGLVSTEEGLPLYQRHGFVEVNNTHKFTTEKGFVFPEFSCPAEFKIRAFTPGDAEKVHALDTLAVGVSRRLVIENRIRLSRLGAVAQNANGEIVAALLGCFANGRLILGPVLAPTDEVALALVSTLGRQWTDCTRIDILGTHRPITEELTRWGMKLDRISPIMTLNGDPLPFDPKLYCGLITQGLG